MNDDLDIALRSLLGEAAPVPGHGADYHRRLAELVGERGAGRVTRRPLWRRTHWLVAAAAAATAVVVATLVGLPGVADRTGPPPVSAAEVVAIAQRALGSGHTLTADRVIIEHNVWVPSGSATPEPDGQSVTRSHLVQRDDGSYRESQVPVSLADAVKLAGMGTCSLRFETAYDAATGIFRQYVRGYEGLTPRGKPVGPPASRVGSAGELITGCAPGAPDWEAARLPTVAFFGTIRADLGTVRAGDVRESTFEGRPVWVVTSHPEPAPWGRGPQVDRVTVTVDQKTGLPVRSPSWLRGVLLAETRLENLHVDVDLPGEAFTFAFPRGAYLHRPTFMVREDMGFQRVAPDRLRRVAKRLGYVPLVPTALPDGYGLIKVATAADSDAGVWGGRAEARSVVQLRYGRGFDALTVSTRRIVRGASDFDKDPLRNSRAMPRTGEPPTLVRLTKGDFSGATARIVATANTVPRLWARKGRLVLIIVGTASKDELTRMAESMRPAAEGSATPGT
jgi:hypothetical protein